MGNNLKESSLEYHAKPVPGKISVETTKPCKTQDDLSMAYTPGVASPCLAIKDNPEDVWQYTSKCNLVAVVSDGTAVLGLGNIGPAAGLPVKGEAYPKLPCAARPACEKKKNRAGFAEIVS